MRHRALGGAIKHKSKEAGHIAQALEHLVRLHRVARGDARARRSAVRRCVAWRSRHRQVELRLRLVREDASGDVAACRAAVVSYAPAWRHSAPTVRVVEVVERAPACERLAHRGNEAGAHPCRHRKPAEVASEHAAGAARRMKRLDAPDFLKACANDDEACASVVELPHSLFDSIGRRTTQLPQRAVPAQHSEQRLAARLAHSVVKPDGALKPRLTPPAQPGDEQ
eukprot:scaffold188794_cov33-Tisochrysis_lutea.AAC.1